MMYEALGRVSPKLRGRRGFLLHTVVLRAPNVRAAELTIPTGHPSQSAATTSGRDRELRKELHATSANPSLITSSARNSTACGW